MPEGGLEEHSLLTIFDGARNRSCRINDRSYSSGLLRGIPTSADLSSSVVRISELQRSTRAWTLEITSVGHIFYLVSQRRVSSKHFSSKEIQRFKGDLNIDERVRKKIEKNNETRYQEWKFVVNRFDCF